MSNSSNHIANVWIARDKDSLGGGDTHLHFEQPTKRILETPFAGFFYWDTERETVLMRHYGLKPGQIKRAVIQFEP